jgi:hypothetical protein
MHTFADGSCLRKISAKELVMIPVWKGNRILDQGHAENIRKALCQKIHYLDSNPFRVVQYKETNAANQPILQTFLIDGQHRAHAIRQHFAETMCEPDFTVLVIEKHVESESEAIDYFNAINNVKPLQWAHDPKLLANKYVLALANEFNKGSSKQDLIRIGKTTKRPFLSGDALREAFEKVASQLKHEPEHIQLFVAKVVQWNAKALVELQFQLLNEKESKHVSMMESVEKRKFALAYNPKLPWIRECLTQ